MWADVDIHEEREGPSPTDPMMAFKMTNDQWTTLLQALAPSMDAELHLRYTDMRSGVRCVPQSYARSVLLDAIRGDDANPTRSMMTWYTIRPTAHERVVTCVDLSNKTDAEECLRAMLGVKHPHCPGFLLGVWWWTGGSGSTRLVTFQDGVWTSPSMGYKTPKTNWARDATLCGAVQLWCQSTSRAHPMLLDVSPDARWIKLTGNNQWLYVVQPEETVRTDGVENQTVATHGDLVHMQFDNDDDPPAPLRGVTGVPFQRRMLEQHVLHRVAYMDPHHGLSTTEHWDVFQQHGMHRCVDVILASNHPDTRPYMGQYT
jgi:hypothetical protein